MAQDVHGFAPRPTLEATAPSAALAMSAELKTMNGALPPSSIETRFIVLEARPYSILPTGVEPVNDTLDTSGLVTSSWCWGEKHQQNEGGFLG